MTVNDPASILFDINGNPVGTTANPLAVTGSISNFPVTQSVFVGNVVATQIQGTPTIFVTSTGSLPVSFPGGVSVSNFPVTQSVFVGNTVPVQVLGTPTITVGNTVLAVSMSNSPFVGISGSVATAATVQNFPVTQSVFVGNVVPSQIVAGTATIGSVNQGTSPWVITGSVGIGTIENVQISNFPVTQSVFVGNNLAVSGLGSAGAPAGGVVSVQGVVSGTAFQIQEVKVTTAQVTSVSASLSPVTVLGSNGARSAVIIHNDSNAISFLKFGTGAQATSFTYRLFPFATMELPQPIYTGIITAAWTVATGSLKVTELSP